MSETGPSYTEDQEARWIAEQQAARSADDERERRAIEEARHAPADTPRPAVSAPTAAAGGAIAGGTVGTLILGPIGTVIGAVGGAVAGGASAAGAAASDDAASTPDYSEQVDADYRSHYERSPHRLADRPYEHARPGYQLGHIVARNPRFRDRSFDEAEPELRAAWNDEAVREYGAWDSLRHFARHGYEESRARARGAVESDLPAGTGATHRRPPFADPIPTYADPAPSSTGQDVAGTRELRDDPEREDRRAGLSGPYTDQVDS